MGSWLVTCTVVLAVILSTLVVGIAVTCVVHKFWKSERSVFVVPEVNEPKVTWPPLPTIILPPPLPPPPESPQTPPPLLIFPSFRPGSLQQRIPHPAGPQGRIKGTHSRDLQLSLRAPDLIRLPKRTVKPKRSHFVWPQPMPVDVKMPVRKPFLRANRPALRPREPGATKSASALKIRAPVPGRFPTVPLRGPQPVDSNPHGPINHQGTREPYILFVIPKLVPNIPATIHVHIQTQHPFLRFNPHALRIGRLHIEPEGPDVLASTPAFRIPAATQIAPVLPRPAPNPIQGGLRQPTARYLPADPVPQDFLRHVISKVLILPEPTPHIPAPPIVVIINTDVPCTPWPTPPPKPPRILSELSISQPKAPIWPRSPMPNLPIATEPTPGLPRQYIPVGASRTERRLLPADLVPQELVQRANSTFMEQTQHTSSLPDWSLPPIETTVTIFAEVETSCVHCSEPRPMRPMRYLPDLSIRVPNTPVWPSSPMPNHPIAISQTAALPLRKNPTILEVCFQPANFTPLLAADHHAIREVIVQTVEPAATVIRSEVPCEPWPAPARAQEVCFQPADLTWRAAELVSADDSRHAVREVIVQPVEPPTVAVTRFEIPSEPLPTPHPPPPCLERSIEKRTKTYKASSPKPAKKLSPFNPWGRDLGQMTSTLGGPWSRMGKARRKRAKQNEEQEDVPPGPGDYSPEHPGIHGRMPGRVPGRPEERRDPNIRL